MKCYPRMTQIPIRTRKAEDTEDMILTCGIIFSMVIVVLAFTAIVAILLVAHQ